MTGTRHPFGGDIGSYATSAGAGNTVLFTPGSVVEFFLDFGKLVHLTDLSLDADGGRPVSHVVASDGTDERTVGSWSRLYGPPDVTDMYASADGGPPLLVTSTDGSAMAAAAGDAILEHLTAVNPHNMNLDDLVDVDAPSPANLQVLSWLNSASKWVPRTVSTSGGGSAPIAVWTPSSANGALDMTTELEAFRAANLGQMVKVADGSKILLKNAFKTVTTGDILLDCSNSTIVYDHNTSSDFAIYCDNTANASAEVSVSSLALATVNTDASVTQLTLGSTLAAKRFDWLAVYSSNLNPAIPGTGYFGEIVQTLADEASLVVTATRQLNKHSFYTSSVKARKLDATRKVHIIGGTFTANGNPEDHAITTRCTAILVQGFVDPVVEDVVFDAPWDGCLQFVACAKPRARNIEVRDIGNLANYGGYTYGVVAYGMNDGGDFRELVIRNGRHAAFTTDGDKSGSSNWYKKGIPTNCLIDGVHAENANGAAVDTHEAGDNIVFNNIYNAFAYQDADINPNFSSRGMGIQLRCSRPTVRNYFSFGGAGGVRVNAIDHGFTDRVHLENIHVGETTDPGSGAGTDSDTAIKIYDQAALTNKRDVFVANLVVDNVGTAIVVGTAAKLTAGAVTARRVGTFLDAGAGSTVVFTGQVALDYRGDTRTAPFYAVKSRSDGVSAGSNVVFMQAPAIIKGSAATPVALFFEADTTATKKIYAPGIVEYNPSAVTATVYSTAGATTFAVAPVTGGAGGSGATNLDGLTDVTLTTPAAGDIMRYNAGSAQWVNVPLPGGGGGAVVLDDLTDVAISSPSNGQVPVYNAGTSLWTNQTLAASTAQNVLVTVTGTSDHGPVIQAVLDDLATSTHSPQVRVEHATKGSVFLDSKVRIKTNGADVRILAPVIQGPNADPDGFGCLSILGSVQTTTTVSSGAVRGSSKVVVLSTASIAPGRLVRFRDTDTSGGASAGDKSESAEVVDVAAGNLLYLDHPLHHTYSGTVTLEVVNAITGAGFSDIEVSFTGQQVADFVFPAKAQWTRHCYFRNIAFRGDRNNSWSREALNQRYCYRNRVEGVSASFSWDYAVSSEFCYGFTADSSTECYYTNCWTSNLRHGYSADRGSAGLIYTACTADNVLANGFDLHGGWTRDITYQGCKASASVTYSAADATRQGYHAGNTTYYNASKNILYTGCEAWNFLPFTRSGGGTGAGAGFTVVDGCSDIVIDGCRVTDSQQGVLVLSQEGVAPITNVSISDVEFNNISGKAIYVNAGVSPGDVDGLIIDGCRFIGVADSVLLAGTNTNTLTNFVVTNNTWNKSTVAGNFPVEAQYIDKLVMSGNVLNRTNRGVKLTGCTNARVTLNVLNELADGANASNVIYDGGGNTNLYFRDNPIIGFTPTSWSVPISSTGASVDVIPRANAVKVVTGVTGTYTVDFSLAEAVDLALVGDVTLTITGWAGSGTVAKRYLKLRQDATGGRIVTWPAGITWDEGVAPTQSALANTFDIYNVLSWDAGAVVTMDQTGKNKAAAPTGSGLPAGVLDLSKWKTTTCRDSSGGTTGKAFEVLQPQLAKYVKPGYFYVDTTGGTGVVFSPDAGGATTSNSGFPREELREMTGSSGTTEASWGTNDTHTHTMSITQQILELPVAKPQVVCGQIHDATQDLIEILADGFRPTSGTVACTGTDTIPFSIMYRFKGSTDNSVTLLAGYTLGDVFTVKIEAGGGQIKIYCDAGAGPATSLKKTITSGIPSGDASGGCFFKAGGYMQSNTSNVDSSGPKKVPSGSCAGGANLTSPVAGDVTGGDAPTARGTVKISALSITHV